MQTSFSLEKLAQKIDHSLLSPTATLQDVKRLCREAKHYKMRAVCVAPTFVPFCKEYLVDSGVKVCTVVGFPLGFQFTSVKAYEAREVVSAGAEEIDMVINLRWVKERRYDFIRGELLEILAAIPGTVVKAIIECAYLSPEEKLALVDVLAECGVHYLKTSTGFAPKGALVEDVQLLAQRAAGRIKIKAAGGIRNLDQALALLNAGAACLGTSSGVQILEELNQKLNKAEPREKEVEIFVDGACLGNPGPGGYAAILKDKGREKVISGGEPHTTNNRMELLAAIKALEALKRPCRVKLYTDSLYLKNGITQWLPKWEKNGFRTAKGQPVKNRDLWERLAELCRQHTVKWAWVKGHAGHPENERCDQLARKEALRYKQKP